MSSHIEARRKLREICRKSAFEALLDAAVLSEEEKVILRMVYLEKQSMAFIGDRLGYSEGGVVKKHRLAVSKLSALI